MEGVKTRIYDNGFTLVYLHDPRFKTVSASLVVKVGSGYEKPPEYGITHVIEHLELEKQKERISKIGKLNGLTSVNETVFDATFFPDKISYFLDVSSDIVTHPPLNDNVLKRERKVIIIERREAEKEECSEREDVFFNGIYRINPFRRSSLFGILGPEENINHFTREDIEKFFERWYSHSNMELYLVGPHPREH